MKSLIIVGAGTAGLMAAYEAASLGIKVTLLEKKRKVGLKLTITGKKRCNVTNIAPMQDFLAYFGKNGNFLRQALKLYGNQDVISFFHSHGVETLSERQGRVFPKSGKATDVVSALEKACLDSGVNLKTSCAVTGVNHHSDRIESVVCKEGVLKADYFLFTVGGATYPGTGSSGDGYLWAKNMGIKTVPLRPALVPLLVENDHISLLRGLDVKNISLEIYIKGKKKKQDFGEISFNMNGMGGALILKHSGWIVDQIDQGKEVRIDVDLKPSLSFEKLDKKLLDLKIERKKDNYKNALRSLLPSAWVEYFLLNLGYDENQIMENMPKEERKQIKVMLKCVPLVINGYRKLSEGIVTQGGVHLSEINPKTFQCKSFTNLYLAGEVLDLHAETGGYNIQAAFTGGALSARDIAQRSIP
jgi:predicted Rossmann fold flavoprotein